MADSRKRDTEATREALIGAATELFAERGFDGTSLNLIAGDLAPDRGRGLLNGNDVTGVSADRRCRSGLARTSQVPRPFEDMSVLENVLVGATYGRPELQRESDRVDVAVDALERTGMLTKANTMAGALPLLDRKRLELSRARYWT